MLDVALAIPVLGHRLLVARRPAGVHLAGSWEFPGGKLAPGERPDDAARRELQEETGLIAGELEPLLVLVHEYPRRPIRFHVYLARDPSGEVRVRPRRDWGWKSLAEIRELEMPEANRSIVSALRWRVAEPAP